MEPTRTISTEAKCVVKIAISSPENYNHICDVVYYRSGMSADFVERWLWFFEYLAARVKIFNPRCKVEFYKGPQNILLGEQWHEHRRAAMIKSRTTKLKQLSMVVVNNDLFGFAMADHYEKQEVVRKQLAMLQEDTYPIPDFPEYINKVKQYTGVYRLFSDPIKPEDLLSSPCS